MKNSEEFRRLVFEKAKSYEIRRRARNKKIAGSVIVCSLVLALSPPISLHLYHQGAYPTEETTAETKASHETAAEASTTPAALTTSTAATTRIETTTEATMMTTTIFTTAESTTEATSEATSEATTEPTMTIDHTTTYITPVPPQTTESPSHAEETAVFDSETYQLFVGDHFTVGAMPYERFIEHYHGAHVLTQTISSEDALLSYLESRIELYDGKIMSIMDFFDAKFFREHDLLIVESPHRVRDITMENGEVTVVLGEVMSKNSVINLIVLGKDGGYVVNSVWY